MHESKSIPAALVRALHDRPDAPLIVGYSGGLDSTVLLHLLTDAGLPVRALHVHHGLLTQADHWQRHCQRTCDRLGIALHCVRVEVSGGGGPEAAARRARHDAFAQALRAGEVLALAHHRDDQAETFLLRALRGAGPDGLAAMHRWRAFAGGHLWRPLLDVPRADILHYAQMRTLYWVDDPSNLNLDLDRAFVRHRVLPLLHAHWPRAAAVLATNAELQRQAAILLEEQDAATLAATRGQDPRTLSVPRLRRLPAARRARILRAWIRALGHPPLPAVGVEMIEHDLLDARADAMPMFAWSGVEIRRWREWLYAGAPRPPLPAGWSRRWSGRAPLPLPGGGVLHLLGATELQMPVWVHARRGGERIALPRREHRHPLKHLLQRIGLPPWERARMPLLSSPDGKLLAAADLAYDARFDAWLRARGARLHWQTDP